MKKILIPILLSLGMVATPFAAQAQAKANDICTTHANNTPYIKATTTFSCAGMNKNITYSDLRKQGYRVISIAVNNYVNGDYSYTDWAIVVEK